MPVRPVLNKDRSFLDKAVDLLISDGPWNRFALICENCSGHNGMVLEEEFKNIKYRCGYCLHVNIPPIPVCKASSLDKSSKDMSRKDEEEESEEKINGEIKPKCKDNTNTSKDVTVKKTPKEDNEVTEREDKISKKDK